MMYSKVVILIVALLVLSAGEAFAHGGQMPPSPPPSDNEPPPAPLPQPPPPPPPPKVQPPTTPTYAPPAPVPTIPPVTPKVTPTTGRTGRGRVSTPNLEYSWMQWWDRNKYALLPAKSDWLDRDVTTPSEGSIDFMERRRRLLAEKHALPVLMKLSEVGNRNDVIASSMIAMAKIANTKEVVDRITFHLRNPKSMQLIKESAALAMGLLRRTSSSLQLSGVELDKIRNLLVVVANDRIQETRIRAFAVLSIGMLAKQPYGSEASQHGKLVVEELISILRRNHAQADIPVAAMKALGMHPKESITLIVETELYNIAMKSKGFGKRWRIIERSHAAAALVKMGQPKSYGIARAILHGRRAKKEIKRGVLTSLNVLYPSLDDDQLSEISRALKANLRYAKDPLTEGLTYIAIGQLVRHDKKFISTFGKLLKSKASGGTFIGRGFATIALGISVTGSTCPPRYKNECHKLLVNRLGRTGSPEIRSAYAVACGIAGADKAISVLVDILNDRGTDTVLAGHSAVALGHLGARDDEILAIISRTFAGGKHPDLKGQAGLALGLLGGKVARTKLLAAFDKNNPEYLMAKVVIALGRLNDFTAVSELARFAVRKDQTELMQAFTAAAMGILFDPEDRPSLLMLSVDSNYPARTNSLNEAFSIL